MGLDGDVWATYYKPKLSDYLSSVKIKRILYLTNSPTHMGF